MNYIKAVDTDKIQNLVEYLSKFDRFNVKTDKGTEFGATEIASHMDNFLEFRRLFATSVYSDDVLIKIVSLDNGAVICKTSNTTYTIHPLHQKAREIVKHEKCRWDTIYDLMDLSYVGNLLNEYVPELDTIILTVDPCLLGNLSITEQAQIERIINTSLEGKKQSMQMCRTVCFHVQLNDDRNRIYAGIYDLEHGRFVNSKPIFEECISEVVSCDVLTKCRTFLAYAKHLEKILKK